MLKLFPMVVAILDFRLIQKNVHFARDHTMIVYAEFVSIKFGVLRKNILFILS